MMNNKQRIAAQVFLPSLSPSRARSMCYWKGDHRVIDYHPCCKEGNLCVIGKGTLFVSRTFLGQVQDDE